MKNAHGALLDHIVVCHPTKSAGADLARPRPMALFSRALVALSLPVLATVAAGCTTSEADDGATQDAITSNDGGALEFSFEGEVVAPKDQVARQAIVAQLQYLNGLLVTDARANGQVGLVTLTGVQEAVTGATKRIKYKAALPVLWQKGRAQPEQYELVLPLDITKLSAFNDKYDGKCGTNEYGRSTFWHDFNPKQTGCTLAAEDVHRVKASVKVHPQKTTGKYPEYDKVWADDRLDVVVVVGVITSNSPSDEGYREFDSTLAEMRRRLTESDLKVHPASASVIRHETLTGKAKVDGASKSVSVTALFVEEVKSTGADFDAIYGPASEKADLIIYSGHSGLGANIKGIADRTKVVKDKYQLVYMNGCQTFSYLGNELHEKKIAANGASRDPLGTKYLDVVANALPAYGDAGKTSLTLYDAMLEYGTAPKTYNKMLEDFSAVNFVAIFGEDDNTFKP